MAYEATEWKPTRHLDGRYQISVVYEHENGRYVSDAVRLDRYIELFEKKLLKWQQKSTERPEHNPPVEIARALQADEREYLEQKELEALTYRPPEEQPRPPRRAVIELPPEPEPGQQDEPEQEPAPLQQQKQEVKTARVEQLREVLHSREQIKKLALIDRYRYAAAVLLGQGKPITAERLASIVDFKESRVELFLRFNPDFAKGVEPIKEQPAPEEAKSVTISVPDSDAAVLQYAAYIRDRFSARDLEIIDDYLAGRAPKGLGRNSVQPRISSLCTKAGIPSSFGRGQHFDRIKLLRAARAHVKSPRKPKSGT